MNREFNLFLEQSLQVLSDKGLKRNLRSIESPQSARVIIQGREFLNFCSNNYLGLANDERLKESAIDSIKKHGVGAGASRLVCGNLNAHETLEKTICEFKGVESCLVFNAGYMANVGIISSLFDKNDIIFSDKLNHASIIDGIVLSGAKLKRYSHIDMEALENLLNKETGYKKRVIITDSVFSMDGDIAPLEKIVFLARKYHCIVMIDEAHALGVMGKNGKGLAEHFGLEKEIDIQMGTLSKAVGSFGAYVCGSLRLTEFLMNKARSFIYTTALPPLVASASQKAFEIIRKNPDLREKLWNNTRLVQQELKEMGFDVMNTQTPIIPILVKDSQRAVEFSKKLFEEGILISAIRPPTVPLHMARLRLTIMATHTTQDIQQVLTTLERIGQELCLI